MTDIQRYSFSSFQEVCENGKCTLEPKAGGIACLFSDHESIVAELQEQVQKLATENSELIELYRQPSALPPEREIQRADWTVKQWVEHVGGRYKDDNPMNYVEFGSMQAVAAMIKQLVKCVGAVGYNQAIADAKALGCKAIKLPAGTIVNGFPMVITQEVINYLHHQGFTVEGE